MIKKYAKAFIALVLSFSMTVSGVSLYFNQALAAPVITAESPQSGMTTLSEDEHITEDSYIWGTVDGSGHSIYVDSGKLTIEHGAIVNADIFLTGKALLQVDGTVNGLITVLSTDSPDARIDWDGTLARPNNININSTANVRELRLDNPRGFGGIAGYIGKITYTENYGGEVVLWAGSRADEIIYNSATDVFCEGNVGELTITTGNFGINEAANIDKVNISGSAGAWISGRVKLLVYNSSNGFDVSGNGRIDTVILGSSADEGTLFNRGTVKNLIVNRGSVHNEGFMENVYLNNCSYFNSNIGDGSLADSYIIKNLVVNSCRDINLSGMVDGSRKYGNIDINGVDGSSIRIWDIIADSVSITGICDYVEINNFLAQYVYLDTEALNNPDFLNMPDPKTVTALNLTVSRGFHDANTDFIKDMIGRSPDKNLSLEEWTDMFLKVENRLISATVDAPQSITLDTGETVAVDFISRDSLGIVQIYAPSGDPVFTLASSGENGTGNFVADEQGTYRIEIYGAKYGGTVNVQVITPYKVELNTFTRYSYGVNEEPVLNKENMTAFTFTLYDETDGKAIYNYILKGNELLLMPELHNHSVRLTARHYSRDWGNYYGFADASVTFIVGSTSSVDVTCLSYGRYDTWIEDAVDVKAYLYNDDSEYVCTLNAYENEFWSEPMPEGRYSVVFVRDPGGQFRFRRLTDYRRYGLREGSAYTTDTFYNKNGVRYSSTNLKVPPAPELEWPNLVKDMTSFSAPVLSGALGTLFDMDLRFQFEDPSVVSDLRANITFSEDCVIMGNEGDIAVGNELTVPLTPDRTLSTFTITSKKADTTLTAFASLAYTIGSDSYEIMIGTVNINVVTVSCNAQTATDDGMVTVYGNATPNQPVTVFDGNTQIAVVTAGENGYWSANVQLLQQEEGYHSISAAVNTYTPQEIRTEPVKVFNALYMPKLQKVIFEYQVHGHADHIELTGPEWSGARWRYDYWPGAIFTFQIQMSNNEQIKDMYVASTTDGSYYSIPAAYDENSGLWIAGGQFCEDQSYLPGDFIIGYTLKDTTSSITTEDYMALLLQKLSQPTESQPIEAADSDVSYIINKGRAEEIETIVGDDGTWQASNVKVTIDDYEANVLMLEEKAPSEKTYEDYINEGYVPLGDAKLLIKMDIDPETGLSEITYVGSDPSTAGTDKGLPSYVDGVAGDIRNNAFNLVRIIFGMPDLPYDGQVIDWVKDKGIEKLAEFIDKKFPKVPVVGSLSKGIYDSIMSEIDVMNKMNKQLTDDKAQMEAYVGSLIALKKITDKYQCSCSDCTGKCDCGFLINMIRNTVDDGLIWTTDTLGEMKNLKIASDGIVVATTVLNILLTSGLVVAKLVLPKKASDMASEIRQGIIKSSYNIGINNQLAVSEQKLISIRNKSNRVAEDVKALEEKLRECECSPEPTPTPTSKPTEEPKESDDPNKPDKPDKPDGGRFGGKPDVGNDPSGYVFEAVESNRLENVTTTVYYQGTDGLPLMWDAAPSGQVNPQITGSDGRYQWFVPSGFWRVEYIKTDYEPYTTQWMRVPPPRVDVNIPLYSSREAQVVSAAVMTDYAEVSFDKYLDVDTIDGLITVDGLRTRLQPVNAEESGLGDGKTYASLFRAVLSDSKAEVGREYTLKVSPTAKCYAGINNAPFEQTLAALPTVTEIVADTPAYFKSGEEITIPIKLNADGSTEGTELRAISSDTSLAKVISVSEPKDDIVFVKLNTAKAGAATLTLKVKGTTQSASVPIVVARKTDNKLIAAATGWKDTNSFNTTLLIIALASVLTLAAGAVAVITMVRKRKSEAV